MAKYVSPEGLDDALSAVSKAIEGVEGKIPTKVSQLTNDKGYTTNSGTVTGVKINGTTKSPSSGVVDLGTVITDIKSLTMTCGDKKAVFDGTNDALLHFIGTNGITITPTVSGNAISLSIARTNATKSEIGLGNVTNDAQVKRSEMGVASGVATLDASGLVPTSQLPSYVDDVLEYTAKSNFPTTGTTGKIYVDTSTNKTYRWGGSAYVEISASLALGTTSSTAYRGDLGAQNATNISTLQGYFDSSAAKLAKQTLYSLTVGSKTFNGSSAITITKADLGLSNVGNFKAVSTVASQGLTSTEKSNARANIGAGTSNFDGAYSSLSGKPTIPTKVSELENDKAYLSSHQSIYGLTIKSSGGQTVKVYTPNQESAIVTLTKDIVGLGNVENKSSATIRGEITKANVTSALGTGTGTTKYLREDGSWATPPNTTYSSKTAASGGTDVSLVTTGEKYTWNSKQSAISDLSTIRSNASNGNTAYGWGNHASAGYQKASTAITTSNIGSQSVSYANSAETATNVAWSGVTGKPSFATVATSGSYNDLSNKPTIPTNTNQLTNGAGFITGIQTLSLLSGSTSISFNGTSDGALNVEGTGGITVTPTKSGNVLTLSISGTAATTSANGLMSSTDKKKLDGIASGAEVNVQSDWNATSGDAFIKNKPTFLTGGSQTSTSSSDGGSNVFTFTKSDGTTATFTVKNGRKGSTGATGATGQRGTGLLAVTTAPSGYTTAVGDITPEYRMALSTIKTQAGVTEVLLGDTVRYSYYHYPIAYLDASYAYFTTRVSIRGATGTNATTTSVATTSANGLMSSSMVTQLDSAATNASNAYALAQQAVAGLSAAPTMSQTTVTSFGTSGMAFNTSYSNSNISFTKVGKIVNIQGAFSFSYTTNKDYAICAIPSGYNPNHNISSWQYITNNGMWRAHIGKSTSGTWTLYLHSIRTSSGAVVETSSRTFVINITYTVA